MSILIQTNDLNNLVVISVHEDIKLRGTRDKHVDTYKASMQRKNYILAAALDNVLKFATSIELSKEGNLGEDLPITFWDTSHLCSFFWAR